MEYELIYFDTDRPVILSENIKKTINNELKDIIKSKSIIIEDIFKDITSYDILENIEQDSNIEKTYILSSNLDYVYDPKFYNIHLIYINVLNNENIPDSNNNIFEPKNIINTLNSLNFISHVFILRFSTSRFESINYAKLKKNNNEEQTYINLLKNVLKQPFQVNRTNDRTKCLFNQSLTFNLENNIIPLLTVRQMPFKTILRELFWFMGIDNLCNTDYLVKNNIQIWNKNTSREFLDSRNMHNYSEGTVGTSYPFLFRNYGGTFQENTELGPAIYQKNGCDQVQNLINGLQNDPFGRRHLINLWDNRTLNTCVLPPCHILAIFNVEEGTPRKLHCMLTMRSNDLICGAGFNYAQYAILTHIIAHICKFEAKNLTVNIANAHIYESNISVAKEIINRTPYNFPKLYIKKHSNKIEDYLDESIYELLSYKFHPKLNPIMVQ